MVELLIKNGADIYQTSSMMNETIFRLADTGNFDLLGEIYWYETLNAT